MSPPTFLYLSHDGVTDHIGQSQIAPYLIGLAQLGHRIIVLSAEKTANQDLISQYKRQFSGVGIQWRFVPFRNKPPIVATLWVQFRMFLVAMWLCRRNRIVATHCRGYVPALIGLQLRKWGMARFIFDPRDFYPDSLVAAKRLDLGQKWLHRAVYWFFKKKEKEFFEHADEIISLTKAGERVMKGWVERGEVRIRAPITVIPCCADFSFFDRGRLNPSVVEETRTRLGIGSGDVVLIYLGSLDFVYMVDEMLELFQVLLDRYPRAKFLIAANNNHERVRKAALEKGIDSGAVIIVRASREEVPYLIAQSNLAVVFYDRKLGREACSPTKLAELFAMSVPVIGNTGLGDLDEILDPIVNGSVVVKCFRREEYAEKIELVMRGTQTGPTAIRENSMAFSLGAGVSAYDRIYRNVIASLQ